MSKKHEQICPVPGCGKSKKNLDEHIRICHPDYVREEAKQESEQPADAPIDTHTPQPLNPTEPLSPAGNTKGDDIPVMPKTPSNFNLKKTLLLIAGAALIIFSIFIGSMWMKDTSQTVLAVITVFSFGGGGFILMFSIKKSEAKYNRPGLRHGGKKTTGPVNSLVIYARNDPDNPKKLLPYKVQFEALPNPIGLYRKLRNDNKYYSTMLSVPGPGGKNILKDCILPDTQYCDPRQFKDAVEMRYSREYYTPEQSLLQKIKPLIFFILIIAGAIILVMLGGGSGA